MSEGRIYSIGHGGTTFAALAERLRQAGIQFVIDVRSVPYSRYQPEFSREVLKRSLTEEDIRYVYMGDLLGGRPEADDCYTAEGHADYAKIRAKDFFRRGIERLKDASNKGYIVCLLCSEGQPSQCHRSKLIGQALADEGIPLEHLLPDGTVRSQKDVMDDVQGRQPALFDEPLVSRKTYR